jgi:hypothetical protein
MSQNDKDATPAEQRGLVTDLIVGGVARFEF